MLAYFLLLIFLLTPFCAPHPFSKEEITFEGVEILNPTSFSQFKCLLALRGLSSFDTGIMAIFLRITKSDGSIDQVGLQNLKNARNASVSETEAFIAFPFFFPNFNKDAAEQVHFIQETLVNNSVPTTALYADLTLTAWSNNITENQQFLIKLNDAMKELKIVGEIDVSGYYSTASLWNKIFGSDFLVPKLAGNNMPVLIWPEITGYINATGFVPFGGWETPNYHLYNLSANLCGVNLGLVWWDWGPFCNIFTDPCCCGLCCGFAQLK